TENIDFYKNNGVDFIGILSSSVYTIRSDKRGGRPITQQLAKNLYRTRYNQSQGLLGHIPGLRMGVTKFKEWMTAYKLESKYEKNEIITMYLNTVSFSNNAYGIKSASLRYFNKQPNALSAAESAVLIGMLKGTTLYNPIRNPDKSIERRNIVLRQMQKEGYISKEQYQSFSKEPLDLNVNNPERGGTNDSYLRTAVEKWLEKWSEEKGIDIYTAGLKIYTTIDSRMQQLAEETIVKQMKGLQERLDNTWRNEEPWRDKSGAIIPGFLEDKARKLPIFAALMEQHKGDEEKVFQLLQEPKKMKIFTWEGDEEVEMSTMDSLKHYVSMLNTGMMGMDPYNGKIKVWIGGIKHRSYRFGHVNLA